MKSWVIEKSLTECAAAGFAKGNVGDFPYTGSYWTGLKKTQKKTTRIIRKWSVSLTEFDSLW